MHTTTHTTVRRVATTTVLAGAAVLVAAPAFARVAPVEPDGQGGHEKSGASGGLPALTQAKVEQMERAMHDPQPAPQPAGSTSNPSDPSSVPVTLLALLGGTVVAGAAGFTVYRFRHDGRVGAATA